MKYDKIEGLEKSISKLIMGNDNQTYFDEAAKLWKLSEKMISS